MKENFTMKIWLRLSIFFVSIAAVFISLYLINHYYSIIYPKTLGADSLCNISGFFNCDTATFSHLASFLKIPTGVFGLIFALVIALSVFIPNKSVQKTNYTIIFLNSLGCLFLLLYSIIILHGLCPGCSLYYLCSFILFGLYYYKFKLSFGFNLKTIFSYLIIFIIISAGFGYKTYTEESQQQEYFTKIYDQYQRSPDYKKYNLSSDYTVPPTQDFNNYPLRMQIFTDFECGFCQRFATKILPQLQTKYKNKLAIQYFFFPLDNSCNKNLSRPMHPNGCSSAKFALCDQENFAHTHDELYKNITNLEDFIKNNMTPKIKTCMKSEKTSNILQNMINQGMKIQLSGTPMIIINNKKFGSGFPLRYFNLLFDKLLQNKNFN